VSKRRYCKSGNGGNQLQFHKWLSNRAVRGFRRLRPAAFHLCHSYISACPRVSNFYGLKPHIAEYRF
jgi:hypothetical protein